MCVHVAEARTRVFTSLRTTFHDFAQDYTGTIIEVFFETVTMCQLYVSGAMLAEEKIIRILHAYTFVYMDIAGQSLTVYAIISSGQIR